MRSLTPLSRAAVAALVLAIALSASVTASAQTVYDAVNDFSIESSTGIWSYGTTPTRGGQFTNFNRRYVDYYFPSEILSGLDRWERASPIIEPYLMRNRSGVRRDYNTVRHPADMLNLCPGPEGENSVVRWTAQAAGMYQIKGRFRSIDVGVPIQGSSPDYAVLHNSSGTLLSGNLTGYGDQVAFTLYVHVEAHDTIDFSVGYGTIATWNDNNFDSTGLAATIKPFKINGQMTDEYGNGVADREIRLEYGTQWIATLTDSNGRYSFNAPMVGTSYTVRAVITDCERKHFRFTPESFAFPSLNEPQTANFAMTRIVCPPKTICREEPPCPL